MNRTIGGVMSAAVAIFAWYLGGWSLMWAADLNLYDLQRNGDLAFGSDVLLSNRYVAILFNSKYYGLTLSDRFFHSPVVSYTALFIGFGSAGTALKLLLTDNDDSEEEKK
jgi:hypothetical protein